jgi:sideroflexin-5
MNILILFGMQHPTQQNPLAMSFWQIMNQTYNVVMNYANRNASSEMPMTEVAKCYVMAVATSCGISVGGKKILGSLSGLPPNLRFTANVLVPYFALAMAGVANVCMMRKKEVQAGIMVQDVNGDTLPSPSRNAGFQAVKQVAISRCVIPLPLMTIPPVTMAVLENAGLFKGSRGSWRNPTNIAVIGFVLLFAAPSAIALFPQTATLPIEKMEPEFHGLKDRNGNPITTVYFNKGL